MKPIVFVMLLTICMSMVRADFIGAQITSVEPLGKGLSAFEVCGDLEPDGETHVVYLSRKCSFDSSERNYSTLSNAKGKFCFFIPWNMDPHSDCATHLQVKKLLESGE